VGQAFAAVILAAGLGVSACAIVGCDSGTSEATETPTGSATSGANSNPRTQIESSLDGIALLPASVQWTVHYVAAAK
jgi:hypothetical protein